MQKPDSARPVARAGTPAATGPGNHTEPQRATIASAITALRWGSVAYGIAVVAAAGIDNSAREVVALAVCVFLTTLRTFVPLGAELSAEAGRARSLLDVAVFAIVTGWTGAGESPWAFCVITAVAVAALGWGARHAAVAFLVASGFLVIGVFVSGWDPGSLMDTRTDLLTLFTTIVAAATGVFLRRRLLEAEDRSALVDDELSRLRQANVLLGELSEIALNLPGAFTLRDALQRIRGQVGSVLDPRVIALVTLDEHSDEWTPKLTDRCAMRSAYRLPDLPEPLRIALERGAPVLIGEIRETDERLDPSSRSGLYVPLRARDRLIGVLGLESPDPVHFDDVDPALLSGLADVIALTVDNTRWFGRLRSLGAEEERIRVARDIHDRLGQWLTYIKLELERLSKDPEISREEISRLHDDASEALDELRETLRQLRSGVSDDRPLSVLGGDLVERFTDRTEVPARFQVAHPEARLPVPVENELLRILQEALNNIDRHAGAEHVEVRWTVDGGNFELVVSDDGRGFDPARAVREQSFGLIGMRERAEVIGANLKVDSRPGEGTRVTVSAGRIRGADPPARKDGHG